MQSIDKNKCPHGRQKSRCKDCGGVGICEHGREKRACKQCNGCPHGVLKRDCKYCGVGCPHGKRKSRCKECGGDGLCFHGRQKDQCIKCFLLGIPVASICEHGKMKKNCRICRTTAESSQGDGRGAVAGPADVADHDPFWNHDYDMHYDNGYDDMLPGLRGLSGEQREAAALDPRFVVQDGFIEEIPFANSDDEAEDDFSDENHKRRHTSKRKRQKNSGKTKKNKKIKKRKVTRRSTFKKKTSK